MLLSNHISQNIQLTSVGNDVIKECEKYVNDLNKLLLTDYNNV